MDCNLLPVLEAVLCRVEGQLQTVDHRGQLTQHQLYAGCGVAFKQHKIISIFLKMFHTVQLYLKNRIGDKKKTSFGTHIYGIFSQPQTVSPNRKKEIGIKWCSAIRVSRNIFFSKILVRVSSVKKERKMIIKHL